MRAFTRSAPAVYPTVTRRRYSRRTDSAGRGLLRADLWVLPMLVLFGSFPATAADVFIAGVISYTGAHGPVSAGRAIQLSIGKGKNNPPYTAEQTTVTANNGAFELPANIKNNYYLMYFLDLVGDGKVHVGDPLQFYNFQLFASKADVLKVTASGITDLNLTFDDIGSVAGITGMATYTGTMRSPSAQSPLVVDAFTVPDVSGSPFDQQVVAENGGTFEIISIVVPVDVLYLRAFLDLNGNGQLDGGEPFSIYQDKGAGSGDPVTVSTTPTNLSISFGDDYIFAGPATTPTPTATRTPTTATASTSAPTPTPTPSPLLTAQPPTQTPSPNTTPGTCIGDCGGNGVVSVEDLVTLVDIALGDLSASACPGFVTAGPVTVNQLVAAVNAALNGCK